MLTREKAFLVIMSICLFQLPSSESCNPRCLCSVTVLMIESWLGGTRRVSLSNRYIETRWEKLKDRRERHRTIQFYKMSNNLTPQYLSNTRHQFHVFQTFSHRLLMPKKGSSPRIFILSRNLEYLIVFIIFCFI
jgi:hypothetical protein